MASNIIFHPNREIHRLKINVQVRSLHVKFYKSACKNTRTHVTTFEYILNINYLIIMNSTNEILVKKIAAIINNNQLTLISPFDRLQFIHFNSILFLTNLNKKKTSKLSFHLNFHPNLFVRSILHSFISPILILTIKHKNHIYIQRQHTFLRNRKKEIEKSRFFSELIDYRSASARVTERCIINANEPRFRGDLASKQNVDRWHRHVAADRRKRPWFHVATLSFPVRGRGRIKRALDRDSLARGRRRVW